jgi:hypothetical protein
MNEFDILRLAGKLQDRANINNIKTNNNNKNFTEGTLLSDNQQQIGYATSFEKDSKGLASLDAKGLVEQAAPPWKYIKLDLFNNASPADLLKGKNKMRLNIAMLVDNNSDYHRLMAALNTDFRFLKRGLDFTDPEQLAHYEAVSIAYKEINDKSISRIRASKCYLKNSKGKGKSIPGMSVILNPNTLDGEYDVIIVHKTDYYTYKLNGKKLTAKQRQGNMIATTHWGKQMTNQISVDEFFKQPPQG